MFKALLNHIKEFIYKCRNVYTYICMYVNSLWLKISRMTCFEIIFGNHLPNIYVHTFQLPTYVLYLFPFKNF